MFLNLRKPRWSRVIVPVVSLFVLCEQGRPQNQSAPNLSGNWQLFEVDGNRDTSNPKFPKMTLVIEQDSFKLTITENRVKQGRQEVRTFVYHADGSGETNTGKVEIYRTREPQLKSVTRTDKGRIVTNFERELILGTGAYGPPWRTPGLASPVSTDTSTFAEAQWSIDASGKKLTLTTRDHSMTSPAGAQAKNAAPNYEMSGNSTHEGASYASVNTRKFVFRRN